MTPESHPDGRRRVWALVLVALAVFYLSRNSARIAEDTGRPSVTERAVAALSGPVARGGFRAMEGLRKLGLSVLFPRALVAEHGTYEELSIERRAATQELRKRTGTCELRARLITTSDQMVHQVKQGLEARVIGRDPTGRRSLLMLDQGATAGVKRGMSVTSGPNLVGTIDRVNRATAVAYALTDRRFSAEARSLRSGDYVGTIEGNGRGSLVLRDIAPGADLREGDVLLTAATIEGPPPDLRIGEVERIGLERLSPEPSSDPTTAPGASAYRLWAVAVPCAQVNSVRMARIPASLPPAASQHEGSG